MNPFLLVAVGLLLIFLEFFLPGMILGILGGIALVISIFVFAAQEQHDAVEILLFIIAVVASVAVLIFFTLRRIPKSKGGFSIYHSEDQEGYQASGFNGKLIGKTGTALSDLKPSGHILIDGKSHQALSESGYITKGSSIKVINGRGAYLVVKTQIKE